MVRRQLSATIQETDVIPVPAAATIALLLVLATAPRVNAQAPCASRSCPPARSGPGLSDETRGRLLSLGVNVALGGLTAAIRQWRNDGSFLDGLWRGAAGGAGTYAGKVVVTRTFPGAGVLGRSVAAVGASVTRNASEGNPSFDRLVLPLGPVRFHWYPAAGDLHASIDVLGAASILGTYIVRIGAALDVTRTLHSGTPVFLAQDWERDWGWRARHVGGTIILRGDASDDADHDALMARALGHERVHLLQYDQAYILWSEPLERRLLAGLGASPRATRTLDLSLHALVLVGLNALIPYEDQPWEREANILADTFGDH